MIEKSNSLLEVTGRNILPQKTLFTQWFYVDCIADVHKVEIYSEAHWELIEKYIALAGSGCITAVVRISWWVTVTLLSRPTATVFWACRSISLAVRDSCTGALISITAAGP